jgi:hypothetical protein
LELAGWTIVVSGQDYFGVKKVDRQDDKQKEKEGDQVQTPFRSFNHSGSNIRERKKKINSRGGA